MQITRVAAMHDCEHGANAHPNATWINSTLFMSGLSLELITSVKQQICMYVYIHVYTF